MKIMSRIFEGLCLFSFFVILCIGFIFPHQNTGFQFDDLLTMNEGWKYSVNTTNLTINVSLPYKSSDTNAGDTFSISRILPEQFKKPQAVCIFTAYNSVRATLDGKEIYSYGNIYSDYPLNNKGFLYNIIPIPAESNGKELVIEMVSVNSKYAGTVNNVYYANKNAVYATLIFKKLPGIVLCTFILLTGILSFVIYFSLRIKTQHRDENFKLIGIFALCSGLWSINQYNVFSLIIGNEQMSYFIDYLCLFLMPSSLSLYIYRMCKERCKKIIGAMCTIHTLFILAIFLLNIARVKEFFNLLLPFTVVLILEMVLTTGTIIYEIWVEKNTKFKSFMVPLMLVLAGGLSDIALYYGGLNSERFLLLPGCIFISIAILLFSTWKRYLKIIADQEKKDLIIKMADIDLMTQAKNRNAFEKEVVEISKDLELLKNVHITEFDLNFLKYINDNYGHDIGDEAIRNCYQLIKKIVGTKGEVFRTGGDEFIAITYEPLVILQPELEMMIQELNLAYPLKISYGTASFDPEQDRDIQDVIKRSDELMYKMKKMIEDDMDEYKRKTIDKGTVNRLLI